MHTIINIWTHIHHRVEHIDDFENFLYVITWILFALIFVRLLVALFMGRWNLF